MQLWITLADVARGGVRTVGVGTQQGNVAVEIEIPLGINDGDTVQYSGLAPGGGDLIITYRIHPDPKFQRQGYNLILEHAVSIWDLIVGADVPIRDLVGNTLTITIPPNTQPGTVMRLRERGLSNRSKVVGDLLVKIQARIPDKISTELLDLIKQNRTQ
jgi:DnaJ-class molecular chaperone